MPDGIATVEMKDLDCCAVPPTVAVSVTVCPYAEGDGVAVSVVTVFDAVMLWLRMPELLDAKVLSPL